MQVYKDELVHIIVNDESCFRDTSGIEGATINAITGVQYHSECVLVHTDRGILVLDASPDCCNYGYLEEFEGDTKALAGAAIAKLRHQSKLLGNGYEAHWYELETHRGDLWTRWSKSSGAGEMYSSKIRVLWVPERSYRSPFRYTISKETAQTAQEFANAEGISLEHFWLSLLKDGGVISAESISWPQANLLQTNIHPDEFEKAYHVVATA